MAALRIYTCLTHDRCGQSYWMARINAGNSVPYFLRTVFGFFNVLKCYSRTMGFELVCRPYLN